MRYLLDNLPPGKIAQITVESDLFEPRLHLDYHGISKQVPGSGGTARLVFDTTNGGNGQLTIIATKGRLGSFKLGITLR